MKKCSYCKKDFIGKPHEKYCSKECKRIGISENKKNIYIINVLYAIKSSNIIEEIDGQMRFF